MIAEDKEILWYQMIWVENDFIILLPFTIGQWIINNQ